jgi:hypothetical protein
MNIILFVTQLKNYSKLLANPAARLGWACALAAVTLAPVHAHATGQTPVNPNAEKLKAFTDRVQKYVDLQKKLEGDLPGVGTTDDPAKIEAHRKALAESLRNARRNARPRDIFGDTAELFRLIIKQDAANRSVRDAFATMKEVPTVAPKVNAEYPAKAPLATVPPLILNRLQPMPDGLEYRFMGRDLILRDSKANLIVDFVHEAVPTIGR